MISVCHFSHYCLYICAFNIYDCEILPLLYSTEANSISKDLFGLSLATNVKKIKYTVELIVQLLFFNELQLLCMMKKLFLYLKLKSIMDSSNERFSTVECLQKTGLTKITKPEVCCVS